MNQSRSKLFYELQVAQMEERCRYLDEAEKAMSSFRVDCVRCVPRTDGGFYVWIEGVLYSTADILYETTVKAHLNFLALSQHVANSNTT